jgi:tRNA threonylcarbamoyladenosine biosynthesis protein TsaE
MIFFGEHKTNSPEETESLGEIVGNGLGAGDVVAFIGELGSGKTTMIRGIARNLGADPFEVASPSFAIIHQYSGKYPVYHIDLYRIEKPSELDQLGLWEIFNGDGISLIEWADRFPGIVPENAIVIFLSRESENSRRIIIEQANGKPT